MRYLALLVMVLCACDPCADYHDCPVIPPTPQPGGGDEIVAGGGAGGGGDVSTGGGGGGGEQGGGSVEPTTCTSNVKWTLGAIGNGDMNPGLACRSCHSGRDFQGQNPNGEHRAPYFVYQFMGTVFPSPREENLCNAALPQGVRVELLDENGAVFLALTPRYPSGNIYSVAMPGTTMRKYRARVTYQGRVRQMGTLQTDGDCNSCHTEQGKNGAPGRIFLP